MVITDELFQRALTEIDYRESLIINANYVLVKKFMPCSDEDIPKYVESIKRANESGINTPVILDYRFIEGTTETYYNADNKEVSYTGCVLLEQKAKGNSIDSKAFYAHSKENYIEYLNALLIYIEELEKRARADQEVFNKFVNDYISLSEFNLWPDPKYANFYFSEKHGYTIIDVDANKKMFTEEIPENIILDIFGNGLPTLVGKNFTTLSFMPKSYYERYNEVVTSIFKKAAIALKKAKIKRKFIKEGLGHRLKNTAYTGVVIEDYEVNDYINGFFVR